MHSRLIISLLVVGALAFACGPRTHSTETRQEPSRASESSTSRTKGDSAVPLASSLRVTVKDGVGLAFHITNATDKKLELTFPSGQTHDFIILDASQREIWRWSRERMFTQSVQTKMLDGGETLTFDERWKPAAPAAGTYTAVALLTSDNHHLESRVEFRLP